MSESGCANCALRAKHDAKPKSLLGRFWRWHINFCPGWRDYYTSLEPAERKAVSEQYNFTKYVN